MEADPGWRARVVEEGVETEAKQDARMEQAERVARVKQAKYVLTGVED